jgi:glycosyltransferase involved in cell wall biosynthesis
LQRELSKRNDELRVYASPRDQLNVESVAPTGFKASIDSTMSIHLGGRALWQTRLNVSLTRGDVLVINGNPRLLSNYPLWLRAKSLGIPVVWWGHGWSAGSHGSRSKIRQRIMRLADAVILYTDKERDAYVHLGFAPSRTFALNNGVDIDSIDAAVGAWNSGRLRTFRSTQGLDTHAYWCIFLGRLSLKSRIDLLIESLPAIRPDVGLIALGDGPLVEEAKARVRALGICSRVVWVGAEYEENAVAPWMLSASALVYPGTVGLSLIHGFAYGLPGVVHADPFEQMPEYAAFENHGNGIAFQSQSAESLALAVNELFDDNASRVTMAENARALVHRTFNVNDMARRFVQAIDTLRLPGAAR